ncbi:probable Xaa-Pro aminopeptidase P [Magnolia sinica]|uniref:probable Xaa-Pro aminopeptidase P n=1 Tax=Magnolia sinica TaxID=86752 RepID=UPI0026585237|nr:probable Xaa-Pro aminopeptidase P [Magnolia sinica]
MTYHLISKLQHFKGLSFPTISSVGPNAAIIHYSPNAKSCSEPDADSIYLSDSGAQPGVTWKHAKEGTESSAFWFALGGKQSYTSKKSAQETVKDPHLLPRFTTSLKMIY